MDQTKRLSQLHLLAGARRDADVAVLERLRVQLRAVEMQITRLEDAAVEHRPEDQVDPTAYQLAGRDSLWDAWRLSRIRELMQKSAQIRADIERQTMDARRSVGKHQVIGKLIERAAVPVSRA